VALEIETGSARFGSAELDAEVPKPTWLNVGSLSARHVPVQRHQGHRPRPLRGDRQAGHQGQHARPGGAGADHPRRRHSAATGSFTIKRLDFKVGEAEWADTSMLANDVQVRFKLVLTGLGPL
jgi:hypothetical protein